MLNILLLLFLTGYILHICIKSRKFRPVSGFRDIFIPVYSLILFLVTMKWNREDILMMLLLFPVAVLAGWFETLHAEVRREYSEKKQKYVLMVRRNITYAVGWIFTFVLGLSLQVWFNRQSWINVFSHAAWMDLIEEFDPFAIFTTSHTWYVWFLSGISSVTFVLVLRHRFQKRKSKEQNRR